MVCEYQSYFQIFFVLKIMTPKNDMRSKQSDDKQSSEASLELTKKTVIKKKKDFLIETSVVLDWTVS